MRVSQGTNRHERLLSIRSAGDLLGWANFLPTLVKGPPPAL